MVETTETSWTILFLLPSAILLGLVAIGWVIKRIWQSRDDEDIAL